MILRLRNPTTKEGLTAAAVTVLVVGVVGAGAAIGQRVIRRRRENRAPIDTVISQGGSTEPPRGGPERPNDAPPAPTSSGQLPDEILAGGVPLEPGWSTVAWYRYPQDSNQAFWIRIDQLGIPSWDSDTCILGACENDLYPDSDNLLNGHYGRISGAWRWSVIVGEATPLATELLQGSYDFVRALLYLRYDRATLENAMIDYAAQRAADWIDTAYGL